MLILPTVMRKKAAAGGTPTQQDIINLTPYAYWSLEDLVNDVWQETSETTEADANSDPIGRWKDLSGNGFDLDQTQVSSPDYRPTLVISGGVTSARSPNSTGVADLRRWLTTTLSSMPSDCSIFYAINATDTRGAPFSGSWSIFWQDGSTGNVVGGSANSGATTLVDDTALTTQDQNTFYDTAGDGSWHVVEHQNVDLSTQTWSTWTFSSESTNANHLQFNSAEIIIIPTANFSASDRTNTIIPRIQAMVGL